MAILFIITLGLATFGCRYYLDRRTEVRVGAQEAALFVLTAYGLVVVSALPLIAANHWNVFSHCSMIAIIGLIPLVVVLSRMKARRFTFHVTWYRLPTFCFLACLALGISLQWKSIYYLYATHDPSAYLNAAHHISRTGTFFHRDEILAHAYGDPQENLKPLLNVVDAPEEWQLTRNFGVLPQNLAQGKGSFHGLFGAPLFFALGIQLFGEENCIRINWVHLLASCLIMVAILQWFLGEKTLWPWLAPALFVISPLVPLIFREPLSEPLAEVFFLGIVFTSLRFDSRESRYCRYLCLVCLAGALCARISSLMYLPFFLIPYFAAKKLSRRESLFFGVTALVLIGGVCALIVRLSPSYITEILAFYSDIVLKRISAKLSFETIPFVYVASAAVILLSLALLARPWLMKLVRFALTKKIWRWGWWTYLFLLGAGLLFRYGKLVTRLTHNFGGYPFVLFNLDSLLFYGCPLLVLVGFIFWYRELSRKPSAPLSFLQAYLPFCFFFYGVFRFLPLNLQVNFQRYLLIELVPLAILGMVAVCYRYYQIPRTQVAVRMLILFCVLWCASMTLALNRNDICVTAFQTYQDVRQKLDSMKAKGERPVLVAVKPNWLNVAYLMPLRNGFDFPVVFINTPFSFQASEGITALIQNGYTPLLVIDSALASQHSDVSEAGRHWQPWYRWKDCHRYARFGLGAPPLELDTSCNDVTFYQVDSKTRPMPPVASVRTAWLYGQEKYPFEAKYWIGWEIDGKIACRSKEFSASLVFNPELAFDTPHAFLNGIPLEAPEVATYGKSQHNAGHWVTVQFPLSRLNCSAQNSVDVFFPPHPEFSRLNSVRVQSAKLESEEKNQSLLN